MSLIKDDLKIVERIALVLLVLGGMGVSSAAELSKSAKPGSQKMSKPVPVVPETTASSKETSAIGLTEEVKPDPKILARARELFGLAQLTLEKGQHEAAMKFIQESVSLNAKDADVQELRASLAVDLQKIDEAVTAYRAVVALMPDRSDARKRLGNVLMRSAKNAEAVTEFLIVLEKDGKDVAVRYNLARCQAFLGKEKEALETLVLCIEQRPSYAQTAKGDPAFAKFRESPAFKKMITP